MLKGFSRGHPRACEQGGERGRDKGSLAESGDLVRRKGVRL